MDFVKIAFRVSARLSPKFDGILFSLPGHVYEVDVSDPKNESVDPSLRAEFSKVLEKKNSFQSILETCSDEFGFHVDEKCMDKLAFAKPGLLDRVSRLMEAVKKYLADWPVKFNLAFDKLKEYEIPFDIKDSWYVDTWVQFVHELVSAMWFACGGILGDGLQLASTKKFTASLRHARRSLEFPTW